jgi:hypothetical protein
MSGKATTPETNARAAKTERGPTREQLCADLERRGIAPPLAARLADDLAKLSDSLTPEARSGALKGIALAAAVQQRQDDALRQTQQDLADIERMMSAFASELLKVDEAVKILSAFVTRIREQRAADPDRTMH